MTVEIVRYESRLAGQCAALIAALPDWFGQPESNAAFLADFERHASWVCCHGAEVHGAAILVRHTSASYEVRFMAVRAELHRQGIGRALLERLEAEAGARGGRWLHLKTLGPSHPDRFYARTRRFYEAMGFEPLFETTGLWGAQNPTVVFVKSL